MQFYVYYYLEMAAYILWNTIKLQLIMELFCRFFLAICHFYSDTFVSTSFHPKQRIDYNNSETWNNEYLFIPVFVIGHMKLNFPLSLFLCPRFFFLRDPWRHFKTNHWVHLNSVYFKENKTVWNLKGCDLQACFYQAWFPTIAIIS